MDIKMHWMLAIVCFLGATSSDIGNYMNGWLTDTRLFANIFASVIFFPINALLFKWVIKS